MKNEKSQLRLGVILNYVNIVLGNLIPVFYTPVMLSLLGQSEYGLYKLSSSVTSYLSLISMGIGSAITRYLIKSRIEEGKDAEEKVLGLFMAIFQIIAIASLTIGMVLVFNLDIWYGNSLTSLELSKMKILVFLMVCNMALSFSQSPYVSVVTAHERFLFLQSFNIITTCLGPIFNIIVLLMGYASIGMTSVTLALGVVTRFVYFVYVRKRLKVKARYKGMPIYLLREILAFSFWIFVSNVVGQLYNATDIVMIGAVPRLATNGVAIYSIGLTLSSMIGGLSSGVSSLLTPMANRMVFEGANNTELTNVSIKVGRIQGYIVSLVVTGFIAFGKPFIRMYAGQEYMDAYWVTIFITVPCVVSLVQSMCLSIIVAQNKHRFRSMVYLFIATVNVIGTWLMMKSFGIIGAAVMTGIATLLGQGLIMNWYYTKKTGLEIGRFWKEVGKVMVIPAIMCIVTLIIGNIIDFYNIIYMFIGIVAYITIFIVLSWKIVMNIYEKNQIISLIKIKG